MLSKRKFDDLYVLPKDSLASDGFIVVECLLGSHSEWRKLIDYEISMFPEVLPGLEGERRQLVLGGFGALGNASSFHNPAVRGLRQIAHAAAKPVLRKVAEDGDKLEQLVDRLSVRRVGSFLKKESWHRDISKNTADSDRIFGGWINLDEQSQFFSCVPGSHLDVGDSSDVGFVTIKDDEAKSRAFSMKRLVVVPPGHMLIFFERILHEVIGNQTKLDSYRLYTAFRLTNDTQPLNRNFSRFINQQAVPQIKSGQVPPMYALLNWVNSRELLIEFSKIFIEECKEDRVIASKASADFGNKYRVVKRFMPSLEEIGHMYEPYTVEDISILFPTAIFLMSDLQ
jgi:hypothetical protein